METRRYTRRREMLDWTTIQDNLADEVIVCAPIAIFLICRKFLRTRAKWRTTYVKSYVNEQFYEIPSRIEFDGLSDAIDAFLEETTNMATCDQIVTELTNIVAQITAVNTTLAAVNTTLAAMDLGPLTNLNNLPVAGDFNDIEEELNAIIAVLGGTEVTLS